MEGDIAELVRLRALLFANLGGYAGHPTAKDDWRGACAEALREQIGLETMRVLVVPTPEGLAACGIGTVEHWLPGPNLHNGRIGHIIGVVTDPRHRRQGHSQSIIEHLLDWFRARDVARVDLHASSMAAPLYRSLGFVPHPDATLCWRP